MMENNNINNQKNRIYDTIRIDNVRIVDKDTDINGYVFIKDGLIEEVKEIKINEINEINETKEDHLILPNADLVIDGKGKVLMPAFADLHAHFRDPGFTYKEDLSTGSQAAVKGGYTSVVLMANTKPVCSDMNVYTDIKSRIKKIGLIDAEPVISISEGMLGQSSEHLYNISDEVKFISDDGKGVMSSKMMEDALELAKEKSLVVMSHAEDHSFSKTDMRKAENYMTLRDIYACAQTGGHLHLCHVSTKECIDMIRKAKDAGINLTCEVTPHHIFLTDDISNYRVNPPIRKKDDVDSIIAAIKDGYVDAIATDHAPHSEEDKKNGSPGISGIETSFQVCLTKLVKECDISLNRMSDLMSYFPCKLMELNKGLVKKGYEADLVLADIDKKTKIDADNFASRSKNTPINGFDVYGEILLTFKKGKIVYNNI